MCICFPSSKVLKRKKRKKLEHEQAFLDKLPSADMYEPFPANVTTAAQ